MSNVNHKKLNPVRIRYTPNPDNNNEVMSKTLFYVNHIVEAELRVFINLNEKYYKIINIYNNQVVLVKNMKRLNHPKVIQRNIKADLKRLGVKFELETQYQKINVNTSIVEGRMK